MDVASEGEWDIVTLIRQDHTEVRSMLTRTASGDPEARWCTYSRLAELLIRHEVAEELVVYPELLTLRGSAVVDSRLHDQAVIERLLVALDREEFDTHPFERSAARLGLEVLEHLGKEEAQVLPLLQTRLGKRRRAALGRRFVEVERLAPAQGLTTAGRLPTGPTVLGRTSVISTWLRDSASTSDLAC
jgi:hypothetical protein